MNYEHFGVKYYTMQSAFKGCWVFESLDLVASLKHNCFLLSGKPCFMEVVKKNSTTYSFLSGASSDSGLSVWLVIGVCASTPASVSYYVWIIRPPIKRVRMINRFNVRFPSEYIDLFKYNWFYDTVEEAHNKYLEVCSA